jgi:hypothetical protein
MFYWDILGSIRFSSIVCVCYVCLNPICCGISVIESPFNQVPVLPGSMCKRGLSLAGRACFWLRLALPAVASFWLRLALPNSITPTSRFNIITSWYLINDVSVLTQVLLAKPVTNVCYQLNLTLSVLILFRVTNLT